MHQLRVRLDHQHWALQSLVNNAYHISDAICDLPFPRALFAGGALWVAGTVLVAVRFFPAPTSSSS